MEVLGLYGLFTLTSKVRRELTSELTSVLTSVLTNTFKTYRKDNLIFKQLYDVKHTFSLRHIVNFALKHTSKTYC
jgi:DNA-binding HxlR family transcriptional regulator